jgi:hypothetical protein
LVVGYVNFAEAGERDFMFEAHAASNTATARRANQVFMRMDRHHDAVNCKKKERILQGSTAR